MYPQNLYFFVHETIFSPFVFFLKISLCKEDKEKIEEAAQIVLICKFGFHLVNKRQQRRLAQGINAFTHRQNRQISSSLEDLFFPTLPEERRKTVESALRLVSVQSM